MKKKKNEKEKKMQFHNRNSLCTQIEKRAIDVRVTGMRLYVHELYH